MAIYLGSQKVKVNLNGSTYIIHLGPVSNKILIPVLVNNIHVTDIPAILPSSSDPIYDCRVDIVNYIDT